MGIKSFSSRARARLKKVLAPRPWEGAANHTHVAIANEEAAYEIGVEAFLFLCPLVLMDLTRREFTRRHPMNRYEHARSFPDASFRAVVRPNFDTLFSIGWLNLKRQPMVLSVPDTQGRYYLLQLLDMWTDSFAGIGKRTTGTGVGHFAVVPPGWKGSLPPIIQRIESPTTYAWIIGRTQTNGAKDFAEVHTLQDKFLITPLSRWQMAVQRMRPEVDPTFNSAVPPMFQLMKLSASEFLAYASRLLQIHSSHLDDQPIIARLQRIGFEVGKPFDLNVASAPIKQALDRVLADLWKGKHTKAAEPQRTANGWMTCLDSIGAYGVDYTRRAGVAVTGLGANRPEDAIYPTANFDSEGNQLSGNNRYTIHFSKADIPPARAFWSLTLYDTDGFPTANPINRYALGDRDPMQYNADGSLTISIGNTSPGPQIESNWLPAPASEFSLTLRLYVPDRLALDGTWTPPPVKKFVVDK